MNTIDDTRLARAVLSWLFEPGTRWVANQILDAGPLATAEQCLNDTTETCPLRPEVAALTIFQRRDELRRLQDDAHRANIRLVCPEDQQWPRSVDRLNNLPESVRLGAATPVCLWVRGIRPVGETLASAITVAGAKACSEYGVYVASEICQSLAESGHTVVTGCSFGIDTVALRGALVADPGIPVAVAACGLDRPYPAGNARLLDAVVEQGLILSAYPPGQQPYRQRFTTTSVLLAGLSRALTSLHAATMLGQPAMVVPGPGPVTSAMSAGCHSMLRDHPGCRLVTSAADILTDLATQAEQR